MKKIFIMLTLALLLSTAIFAAEVTAVDVDLERYEGKWYEIGRYGLFFENGLSNVTAEYTIMEDGKIKVVNQGYYGGLGGLKSSIQGSAYAPNPEETGKLLVKFFGSFESDYWVIELDKVDYSYAVVSQPGKKFLWILSRTPKMDAKLYDEIVDRLETNGFPVGRIEKVSQKW